MSSLVSGERFAVDPHQVDAFQAIDDARLGGESRLLLEMATGLRKTRVAAMEGARIIEEDPDARLLVLAHRAGIVRHLVKEYQTVLGDGVETGLVMGGEVDDQKQAVFATFQTMAGRYAGGRRYQAIDEKEFKFVNVDEGHHGPADTYRDVIEHCDPELLLGMTGTPYRLDGKPLDDMFGRTVYRKTLPEGIREGLLSPMIYRMHTDRLRDIGELQDDRGKLTLAQLDRRLFIPKRDDEVADIFGAELQQIEEPHGLIFCKDIQHAERMAVVLSEFLPYTIAPIHSKQPLELHDNNAAALLSGELQLATVVSEYDEGIDVPEVNFIGFLRNSASERVWLQELGRGLRRIDGKIVHVVDLATTLDRITMVHRLDKSIQEHEPAQLPDAEARFPVAQFNFSQEAMDVSELADEVRARMEQRRIELANRPKRTPRRREVVEEEVSPADRPYLGLADALERNFSDGESKDTYFYGEEIEVVSEVARWKLYSARFKEGGTYPSENPATQNIRVFMQVIDYIGDECRQLATTYGMYEDGTIMRLDLADKTVRRRIDVFEMGSDYYRSMIHSNVVPVEPTEEELQRLEALANFDHRTGSISGGTTFETIRYASRQAQEFGRIVQRIQDELVMADRNGARNGQMTDIHIGDKTFSIMMKNQAAFNFPDASIVDRAIASITVRSDKKEEGENRSYIPDNQYVLLEDGTLVNVDIVDDRTGEAVFLDVNSFTCLPTGTYSAIETPPQAAALRSTLDTLQEYLGGEIDWENITIRDVLDGAMEAFNLTKEEVWDVISGARKDVNLKKMRGLVYQLILDRGIGTIDEIEQVTNYAKPTIRASIKAAEEYLTAKLGYGEPNPHVLRSKLIRQLPRKPIPPQPVSPYSSTVKASSVTFRTS